MTCWVTLLDQSKGEKTYLDVFSKIQTPSWPPPSFSQHSSALQCAVFVHLIKIVDIYSTFKSYNITAVFFLWWWKCGPTAKQLPNTSNGPLNFSLGMLHVFVTVS